MFKNTLSPVYLHRHSRHTLSNDILPFAKGTALVDILRENVACDAGANAEVRVAKNSVASAEVFMVYYCS